MIASFAPVSLAACAAQDEPTIERTAVAVQAQHITVHKTLTCGCCGDWVDYLKAEGFAVTVHNHEDLTPIRERLNIPTRLASCHSAEVDGYSLEGHVPASAIRRLLTERPDAIGLSVPGMIAGTPGMEVEGISRPYRTLLFGDGEPVVFSQHNREPVE
ncbi:MAG: DUF411 domain-containing protein [Litorimonas sp.]